MVVAESYDTYLKRRNNYALLGIVIGDNEQQHNAVYWLRQIKKKEATYTEIKFVMMPSTNKGSKQLTGLRRY